MKDRLFTSELLAPAGTKEAFIAAVEAGADAVYCGASSYNARMSAGNFDEREMRELLGFANKRNVKVYITVNTLLDDDEVFGALRTCETLRADGAAGLIVQDLGVARLVRKYLPDLPIHTSTQASVYSLDGVLKAKELGFSRVVTARELSLAEIEYICKNSGVEIEVFCHGAMCICYSGQCQMSRALGGRSGNKGACAQPCRLPYTSYDEEGRILTGASKYPLSPSDMSMLDHLPELCSMGVASLKIEGRMKSPEYVGTVTSIYRKYLDLYAEGGTYKVSAEDREAMTQIFNRGFTDGWATGTRDKHFMSFDIPKHKGLEIGTVTNPNAGRNLIEAKLFRSITMGDGVEIRGGDRRAGNVVTYIQPTKNGTVKLGDFKEAVSKGDHIYKITSKEQLSEVGKLYKNKDWHAGNFLRKSPIDATVISDAGGDITLILTEPVTGTVVQATAGPFAHAPGESCQERIVKSLQKTGGTPFVVSNVEFAGNFDKSVPMSALNELRRGTLSHLEVALEGRRGECKVPGVLPEMYAEPAEERAILELAFFSWDDFEHYKFEGKQRCLDLGVEVRYLLPAAELVRTKHIRDAAENPDIYPYITSMALGKEDELVEEGFEELVRSFPRGIYVGGLGWLGRFVAAGATVIGDQGLNVYNKVAESAVLDMGAIETRWSKECQDPSMTVMPLMVSRSTWDLSEIKDRKDVRYKIVVPPFSSASFLLEDKAPHLAECIRTASDESRVVRTLVF